MPMFAAERREILDSMQSLACVVSHEGRFSYANEAYRRHFGVDPAQLKGKRMVDFVGPDAFAKLSDGLLSAMEGAPATVIDEFTFGRDEARTFCFELYPAHDGACLAIIQDVTDLGRQLRERDDEVWRTALHDLKNLLQPVAAYLDILAVDAMHAPDPLRDAARSALASCTGMAQDMASRPILHPTTVAAVRDEVRGMVALHAATRPDVAFADDIGEAADHQVLAYNGRAMKRLLSNLIVNSFSHAWSSDMADRRIDIAGAPTNEGWRLGYRDNGVGLPQDMRPNDAEPVSGGLGLQSIVRIAAGAGWKVVFPPTDRGVHALVDVPFFTAAA